jgi:hydroxymethylbilane synthase
MLAVAGLKRLGLEHEIAEILEPEQVCPAAGQGALAIETRSYDPVFEICRRLNHDDSSVAVACERAALAELGGGCQLPVGAFAECKGGRLRLMAVVVAPDGSRHLRAGRDGPRETPEELGRAVAEELLARGAGAILTESR